MRGMNDPFNGSTDFVEKSIGASYRVVKEVRDSLPLINTVNNIINSMPGSPTGIPILGTQLLIGTLSSSHAADIDGTVNVSGAFTGSSTGHFSGDLSSGGSITSGGLITGSSLLVSGNAEIAGTLLLSNSGLRFANDVGDDTGFRWVSEGVLAFLTNAQDTVTFGGSAAMSVTGNVRVSGNAGVGTINPKTRLQITAGAELNAPVLGSAVNAPFYLTNADVAYGLVAGVNAGDGHVWFQAQRTDGGTTPANVSFCEAGGAFLVGTPSRLQGNTLHEVKTTVAGTWALTLNCNDRGLLTRQSASSGFYAFFENNGGTTTGSISHSGSTTAYNTTSDERIKENITNAPDAGSLLDAIQIRSWDFKADGSHWRFGVVAQELLLTVPEAVNVPIDPTMMMGVDYSKLVPLLIKEMQALRGRVAALEAAL